jgi:hypothetical protein
MDAPPLDGLLPLLRTKATVGEEDSGPTVTVPRPEKRLSSLFVAGEEEEP